MPKFKDWRCWDEDAKTKENINDAKIANLREQFLQAQILVQRA